MKIKYLGLEEINGPLVFIKTPKGISFEEQVEITLKNGEKRTGNVLRLDDDITTIQVYKGTNEINIKNIEELYVSDRQIGVGVLKNWTGRKLDLVLANKINELIQEVNKLNKERKNNYELNPKARKTTK